jgi:hypothetical protein
MKTDKKLEEMNKSELLQYAIALSKTKSDADSEFFCRKDKSIYKFSNLTATLKAIELYNVDVLQKLKVENNNERFTIEHFHNALESKKIKFTFE